MKVKKLLLVATVALIATIWVHSAQACAKDGVAAAPASAPQAPVAFRSGTSPTGRQTQFVANRTTGGGTTDKGSGSPGAGRGATGGNRQNVLNDGMFGSVGGQTKSYGEWSSGF